MLKSENYEKYVEIIALKKELNNLGYNKDIELGLIDQNRELKF
jgi:hypothetical protein